MFALSVLVIVIENIISFNLYGDYPDLYSLFDLAFSVFLTVPFLAVFISARNKDSVLPTGGFTAAGILCILSSVVFAVSNVIYYRIHRIGYIFVYISVSDKVYPGGLPDRLYENDLINVKITGAVLFTVMILFCLILAATFFSAASVAKNNKPRRFFPILLTVLSFAITPFYIVRFIYFLIAGDFYRLASQLINAYFYLPFEYVLFFIVSFISEFIISPITLILCGCMGIGFAKASRRIK